MPTTEQELLRYSKIIDELDEEWLATIEASVTPPSNCDQEISDEALDRSLDEFLRLNRDNILGVTDRFRGRR